MIEIISENMGPIVDACRRMGVRRLEVFGSAARGDFEPDRSDLDFVVEFEPGPRGGLDDRYFRLRAELERIVKRPVDLVERGCVTNPVIAAAIERGKVPVYAAA